MIGSVLSHKDYRISWQDTGGRTLDSVSLFSVLLGVPIGHPQGNKDTENGQSEIGVASYCQDTDRTLEQKDTET